MQIKYISFPPSGRPTLLRKAITVVSAVALGTVALMFSAVLLVLLLVVGFAALAWYWWMTPRVLREQMRAQRKDYAARGTEDVFRGETFGGEVIEGEAIRVDDARSGTGR